ncbi:NAD-dependent succinate-semialdehyde dehydrogenase [Bosea sp. LjRoot9]|uniref:NAD-dependent succinate-semialdehyde dehydrogenase n=1 Tax=Bosea sp. LjRoot9 TaxID=3342341 RepID=UPI003ECC4DFF
MTTEIIPLFIDGAWRTGAAGDTIPVVDPATEEVFSSVACASAGDLDLALDAAARAFLSWKHVPAAERARVVGRAADLIEGRKFEIARILTRENGKPLAEAEGELQFCADASRWYAEEGKRAYGRVIPSRSPDVRQIVMREPVGPALGFAAWNFPGGNVTLKIAAALSAGCSIIVKPSDETPGTAAAIARCFEEAGVPAGVLNVVFGPPAEISRHLIASPIAKKVSLTGSTPVGKLLQRQAAETLKRCTMELGGHAPVIVFADADLERALDALVAAKFRNAGQVCTSPTRFFVHESRYEDFIRGFVERTQTLTIGNGLDRTVSIGPLITSRRRELMDGFVQDATARGARIVLDGGRRDGKGYFYAPVVLRDVPDEARIMTEEPFGPLVPVTPFASFDEVIARANALPFGLASYAFTRDASTVARVSDALDAGQVGINHTSVHEPETPFGGVNESGYGAESGIEGLDAYLRTKLVTTLAL